MTGSSSPFNIYIYIYIYIYVKYLWLLRGSPSPQDHSGSTAGSSTGNCCSTTLRCNPLHPCYSRLASLTATGLLGLSLQWCQQLSAMLSHHLQGLHSTRLGQPYLMCGILHCCHQSTTASRHCLLTSKCQPWQAGNVGLQQGLCGVHAYTEHAEHAGLC